MTDRIGAAMKAQPMTGGHLMISHCRNCGEKIERWSGRGSPWTHGEIGSLAIDCEPEALESYRLERKYLTPGGEIR